MKLFHNIKSKNYNEAYSIFEKSFESLRDGFELETYENASENLFKFIIYVGEKTKKSNVVYFCSMILATSLNYFKDAYKYSYDFAKKSTEIDPHNLENWEWLLFFANIPDKVMNTKDLEDAIINALRLDDQNKKALSLLNTRFTESEITIISSKI